MGVIELSRVSYSRPGASTLFSDISFRVGNGAHLGLIGSNGVGKTTLLRLIAASAQERPSQEDTPTSGTIRVDGSPAMMHQFVAGPEEGRTVRDLLVSLAPVVVRDAGTELAQAVDANEVCPDVESGFRVSAAFARWGELGGYEFEVLWDASLTSAVGAGLSAVGERPLATLSGGEQKRLALEVLLRGDSDVVLLDEPDNFLDVDGKEWLEGQMNASRKTILFVSHDRQLLANTADRLVTVEGRGAWTHGAPFATYHQARDERLARLDDEHRRWKDERDRLYRLMRTMKQRAAANDANASRARAAETRLRHFDQAGPPGERVREQSISMRLGGGRTGKRVVTCEGLVLSGMTDPFDTEVLFGERVAVLGGNGTGKSHFLKLLAGEPVRHTGTWALGARVVPGYFAQIHDRPGLLRRRVLDVVGREDLTKGPAMAQLRRYGLHGCADQTFETMSGGQQARLQILLLELSGCTLLLLDEPTDNLDLESAEALEEALAAFEGTVLAVTHDRWFTRCFDRFLVFDSDKRVRESPEAPAWVGSA